jgi:predicted O-methyltransferase YrrM
VSYGGTAAYANVDDAPPLVRAAVDAAQSIGFGESCLPAQGRLLALLAAGVGDGVIGETGTGCGVGLAWMAQAASAGARLVSVDRDEHRVKLTREVFAARTAGPPVEIVSGDWSELAAFGPFDLLVLDGGGHGKSGQPLDPARWLRPGGVLVIDDFTPFTVWPPRHGQQVDRARLHWLQHDRLLACEIPLTTTMATIVGRYVGPDHAPGDHAS